jgi:hypothetical protein
MKLRNLKRSAKFFAQRIIRGWSDEETWSLDAPLGRLIAPRLRRYNELRNGHPCDMTEEEWNATIQKMVDAFEWYGSDERYADNEFEMLAKHQEGINLFAKHYNNLWW